jgi:hypothetical protein
VQDKQPLSFRRDIRGTSAWLLLAALSAAAVAKDAEPVTVRVLPQAAGTNSEPFRLGLQVGFLEGPGNPLRAECFSEETLEAEAGAALKAEPEPNTGRNVFRVAVEGARPSGVSLTSSVLRRGVGYTARVRCRRVRGSGALKLVFAPVGGAEEEEVERTASVKGADFGDASFAVRPRADGAYRCAFRLSPGSVMEFSGFSLVPDDAADGWDSQALEALRAVGAGDLRWPVQKGVGFYNWYDGVGPRALRRAVSPTARAEDGHDFGTVEFVAFCRLVGAKPLIRVTVFGPGCGDARVENSEAAVRLAADWVAYCNATNGHPLAALRARHGHTGALGVARWELAAEGGGTLDGAACRAYAAAMKAEDPAIEVGVALEGSGAEALEAVLREAGGVVDFVSCDAAGAWERVDAYNRRTGARLRIAATRLQGVRDRYVTQVMGRLDAGDAAELRYYGGWYDSLALTYAALAMLGRGGGVAVCAPSYPEQVLYRVPYAKNMLDETGLLLALFNRFPARVPLVAEGLPADKGSPFRVQAAWTEDDTALVVYVYNSGTEARAVRLDLTALKRRFGFWVSDQLAADITARREEQTVPVSRRQKAGAALTQVIPCEAAPASFTRIVVKE